MTTFRTAVDPETVSLLRLRNSEPCNEARIATVSLPVPMNAALPSGIAGLATQAMDIAWWPDSRSGGKRVPRRRLLFGMSDESLANEFKLGQPANLRSGLRSQPKVNIPIVHKDHESMLPHEVGELRFACGGKRFGLRLGVRWKDELHWWEWLRLEQIWAGPVVNAYRVGGFIEVVPLRYEEVMSNGDANSKRSSWLHRQDWLFGEVFVLCFVNGVIQLTCRHVNNHRFDEGREQKDIVPVIGFTASGNPHADTKLDGSKARFQLGDATLDLSEALPLVSPEHPGSLRRGGERIVYQPYEGVEIAGDDYGRQGDGGFLVRASEKRMPKGVARTVRFAASLGDVSPVITHLTVPEWWYAVSGDLWPDGALPVRDYWDKRIDSRYQKVRGYRHGTFDVNHIANIFEGEVPYSQLLYFYRSGNLEHGRRAIRDAYYIADIAFDHSTETMRMHDYPLDGSTSPALFRTVGMLFGYLETGDPYLLECAESATSHWYWMDRHNWPRFAYGRDGASIRSLVFLWDYTGNEDYRVKARDAMRRMIQCQQADGSYRDQGGGTGIHAASHMPVKPWMTNLATDAILDYLERCPDEEPDLWRAAAKAWDFMLRVGIQPDGTIRWPYQVRYADSTRSPWVAARQPETKGRLPTPNDLVHGHKARLFNLATRRTGDARYFDTWRKFFDSNWADASNKGKGIHPHPFNKQLQHLPYGQAHTWNAHWENGELSIRPIASNYCRGMSAIILTPRGPVSLRIARTDAGNGHAPHWEIAEQKGPDGLRVTVEVEQEASAAKPPAARRTIIRVKARAAAHP